MDASHSHYVESQARHKQMYNAYFHFYGVQEQMRGIYNPSSQKKRDELTESSGETPVDLCFLKSMPMWVSMFGKNNVKLLTEDLWVPVCVHFI